MPKPIVCPECIAKYQNGIIDKDSQDGNAEDEEKQDVKSFSNWRDYAEHILIEHPYATTRVNWVISCVNDEYQKCKAENTLVPASIKKLMDLIEGRTKDVEVVSVDKKFTQSDVEDWKQKLRLLHDAGVTPQELSALANSTIIHDKPSEPSYLDMYETKEERTSIPRPTQTQQATQQERVSPNVPQQPIAPKPKVKVKRNYMWLILAIFTGFIMFVGFAFSAPLMGIIGLIAMGFSIFLFLRKPTPKVKPK